MSQLLQEWLNENWIEGGANYKPDTEKLFARKSGWRQIEFIRKIKYLTGSEPKVISTHRSKSLLLPVYELTMVIDPFAKVVLTARENFHGWVVSVQSPAEFRAGTFGSIPNMDFDNHDIRDGKFLGCYAEGFPKDRLFSPPLAPWREATFRMGFNEDLYMLVALIKVYFETLNLDVAPDKSADVLSD